jgi:hypothetical protein
MAYMKSTLTSSPIEPPFAGVAEALGFDYGAAAGAGTAIFGGVMNLFGQKEASKQQTAAAAAATAQARIAEAQAAQAAAMAAQSGGGIPTTYLLIGGAVLAGVLVFAMRRK